ncbi:helix-turn-helix domain-containing protein [Ursidibacter arcticus]
MTGYQVKQHKIHLENQYPSISGNITINYFRSGLRAKYSDIEILSPTSEISGGIFTADLRLVITLTGVSKIQFENGVFRQDATSHPKAAFLSIAQDEQGWKHFSECTKQSEFVVFISRKWLMDNGFLDNEDYISLQRLSQQHLTTFPILANQRILTLVKQLKSESVIDIPTILEKESLLLALLSESFAQLFMTVKQNELQYIQTFTKQLESGKFDTYSLAQIAKTLHTNVTTLQRDFKQIHHISIGAYLRRHKLELAYNALLQGASVTMAAEIAGYTNPDNFSTAFRRQFSVSPRYVKQERLQALSIL